MLESTSTIARMSLLPEASECLVSSSSVSSEVSEQPKAKRPKWLPRCRVCGDNSSGLHYGVNTCEACKGFFRRSHSRGDNFQCVYTGDCDIKPDKRSNCPACRYRKCLAVGMSKDAIKIGRYTHEKRTQDMREVRKTSHMSKLGDSERQMETSTKSVISNYLLPTDLRTSTQHEFIDSSNQLISTHEQKIGFSMSVVDEMQKYVQKLSEAMVHMKYFFAAKPPKFLNHLIQTRLDESQFETELLGDDVIPNKEYVKVMAETGLDLDQRKELIQHWAEGIEETFIVVAQFAKCTPGFKNLPLPDQITLVKATRSQLLFAASHKRFDVKHKCFIGRFNRVESYQDIVKVYNNRQFVNMMIELAGKLTKTRLTDIELLLVMALIMTYPDDHVYSKLSNQAKGQLKVMHRQEQRVLDFYMKLNHPDQPELGSALQSILQEMREVNEIHDVLVEELQEVWTDFYSFPPLFSEIMQIDFKRRVIPRLTPKVSLAEPAVTEAQSVPTSSIPKQHWKKSKIAHILQSSEYFDKLMTAATARSRDENVLPTMEQFDSATTQSLELNPSSQGSTISTCTSIEGLVLSPPTQSSSINSKLNSCYGISFGDPLSPLANDIEPLSKCLDYPFTACSTIHTPDTDMAMHVDDETVMSLQAQLMTSSAELNPMQPTSAVTRPVLSAYHRTHRMFPVRPIRASHSQPIGRGKDDSVFDLSNSLMTDRKPFRPT